ncbi:arsenate reductase (glutaredoxin) [Wenzhouxiangella sp. XN79A]|uniref:arsenate reductase (glutaredoxin) n=1 Tax=Wenzhouxiangella sp. XN79A TaxID=2724193 RepID=UPI00144AA8A7|nr:arsenate reductase (glutaredoxin) [Wenzhouxiangella sp. XN79A]NKI34995.1 arsenate reductase (glutaredoxin) [Wenzhouxiangella sp. XN79A]
MQVTVYHNPRCSKSRATLKLLAERGLEPTIVDYLRTPPNSATLEKLAEALDRPARDLVRTGQAEWARTGLDIDAADDAELFDAIAAEPILLQRPIVVVDDGALTRARIGRPPEDVEAILP